MGLDPFGRRFHLLNRAGVKVAVWCVDNPFHLLTAIRSDFWRQTILMVTDDWFCAPLRACGAKTVFHLPLAVWPQCFHPKRKGADYNLAGRMVFVGSFPVP